MLLESKTHITTISSFFTESAHWADTVCKSRCPWIVCVCVVPLHTIFSKDLQSASLSGNGGFGPLHPLPIKNVMKVFPHQNSLNLTRLTESIKMIHFIFIVLLRCWADVAAFFLLRYWADLADFLLLRCWAIVAVFFLLGCWAAGLLGWKAAASVLFH